MRFQPSSNACDCALVRGRFGVWTMKHLHLAKENHCDSRPFTFVDFAAQGLEQGLYIPPMDVGRGRVSENRSQGLGMLAFHVRTVSLLDTTSVVFLLAWQPPSSDRPCLDLGDLGNPRQGVKIRARRSLGCAVSALSHSREPRSMSVHRDLRDIPTAGAVAA